jgi:hypothetical protein
VAAGYKVVLTWSKYTCDHFDRYGVYRADGTGTPSFETGQTPSLWYSDPQGNPNILTMTDTSAKFGQTYSYIVIAYSESTVSSTGGVIPACEVVTVLGVSNKVTVVVPAS